jgi:hypothetical protein
MSPPTRQQLLDRLKRVDDPADPEIEKRSQQILNVMLSSRPEVPEKFRQEGRQEGRIEGQLIEARKSVRRVLARRRFALGAADDARIDACTDLSTLERWLDQSITATSIADALA